jgi:alanine racemase
MSGPDTAGAILSIDLDAVVANWRLLRRRLDGTACAAVVKADAYGLGVARVAPALAAAGCDTFFVATIDEGVALRRLLGAVAGIHVLNGLAPDSAAVFAEHGLVPVLGSLDEIAAWAAFGGAAPNAPAADVHVDTGMSRLGLAADELDRLVAEPERLAGVDVAYLISHLACAEESENPMNRRQLDALRRARAALGLSRTSFANSSGIFLGPDFHFDMARPGAALYGIAPQSGRPNPMAQVIRLQGKIVQVRTIDRPKTVGYGATHRAAGRERIATVAVGYADGYPRTPGNVASGFVGDVRVPVVGRVSMDLITFDVSAVDEARVHPGAFIDLIGPNHSVDDLAAEAGTIGYEILTRLGRRYHRVYTGADAS